MDPYDFRPRLQPLPDLSVPPSTLVKQEPEDKSIYTATLIPDDGFDEVYEVGEAEWTEDVKQKVPPPAMVYIADDDDLAPADHDWNDPSTTGEEAYSPPNFALGGSLPYRSAKKPKSAVRNEWQAENMPSTPTQHPTGTAERENQKSSLFIEENNFASSKTKSRRKFQDNGDRFPTKCFEGAFADRPHHHLLSCGHTVQTNEIVACGKNCQQSDDYDGKAHLIKIPIQCEQRDCRTARRAIKRQNIFIPTRKPGKQFHLSRPSHVYGFDKYADAQRYAMKQGEAFEDFDSMGLEDQRNAQEPRRRTRARSRSPTEAESRAYRERSPFVKAEQLTEAEQQLKADMAAAQRPKLNSVLRGLEVEGTDKLARGAKAMHTRAAQLRDPEAARTAPHSYGNGGIRSAHPGFSMPEHAYHKMREAEGHVVVENEVSQPLEVETNDSVIAETRCTCKGDADSYMVQCHRCEKYFHPKCEDKGLFAKEDYEGDERFTILLKDAEHYQQGDEPFTCSKCDEKSRMAQEMLGTERKSKASVISQLQDVGKKERKAAAADREATQNEELFGETRDHETDDSVRIQKNETLKKGRLDLRKTIGNTNRVQKPSAPRSRATVIAKLRARPVAQTSTIRCDLCGKQQMGLFYHCTECTLFDVCGDCMQKGHTHSNPDHEFVAKHAKDEEQPPWFAGGKVPKVEPSMKEYTETPGPFKRPNARATNGKATPQRRKLGVKSKQKALEAALSDHSEDKDGDFEMSEANGPNVATCRTSKRVNGGPLRNRKVADPDAMED